MPTKRKIVVDGIEYRWVYSVMGIVVFDAKHERYHGCTQDVTGLHRDAFDCGQWNRTKDGMITPGMVANWIRTRLQDKLSAPAARLDEPEELGVSREPPLCPIKS